MAPYVGFMILILIEWMLFVPKVQMPAAVSCRPLPSRIANWVVMAMKSQIGEPVGYARRKRFMILVCIELICFAGIRSLDLGADISNYLGSLRYYRSLAPNQILGAELVWPYDYEVGYFFLTKLCAWLNMSDTVFLFAIAIIIYVPVCWFLLQYSANPAIGILVYFAFSGFTYSLGIFRQMIALSILLIGSKFIIDRKLIWFVITVGIAMLFHTTAVVLLPFYWIYKMRLSNKIPFIIIAEIICFLGARPFILLVIKIFPKYSGLVSSQCDTQGGSYVMLILLNILLIVGCIIAERKENRRYVSLQMSLNATVVAVFLQIIGYSMEIFGRIVPYYSIYLTILIPCMIIKCFRKKTRYDNRIKWKVACGIIEWLGRNTLLIYLVSAVLLIVMFWFLNRGTNIDSYMTVFTQR